MQDKENSDLESEDPQDPEDPEEVDHTSEFSETDRVVDMMQDHCAIAKIWMTDFALFSNPFLNSAEVNILLHQVWRHAEDKQKVYAEHPTQASALIIHYSLHPSRPITVSL